MAGAALLSRGRNVPHGPADMTVPCQQSRRYLIRAIVEPVPFATPVRREATLNRNASTQALQSSRLVDRFALLRHAEQSVVSTSPALAAKSSYCSRQLRAPGL